MPKQKEAQRRSADKARKFRANRRTARLETQQLAQDTLNVSLVMTTRGITQCVKGSTPTWVVDTTTIVIHTNH